MCFEQTTPNMVQKKKSGRIVKRMLKFAKNNSVRHGDKFIGTIDLSASLVIETRYF